MEEERSVVPAVPNVEDVSDVDAPTINDDEPSIRGPISNEAKEIFRERHGNLSPLGDVTIKEDYNDFIKNVTLTLDASADSTNVLLREFSVKVEELKYLIGQYRHFNKLDEKIKEDYLNMGKMIFPIKELNNIDASIAKLRRRNWLSEKDVKELRESIIDRMFESERRVYFTRQYVLEQLVRTGGRMKADPELSLLIIQLTDLIFQKTGEMPFDRIRMCLYEQGIDTPSDEAIKKAYDRGVESFDDLLLRRFINLHFPALIETIISPLDHDESTYRPPTTTDHDDPAISVNLLAKRFLDTLSPLPPAIANALTQVVEHCVEASIEFRKKLISK